MAEPLLLWRALGICPGDLVAFTGGGGKSSLAVRVVRELAAAGRRVIFTCTTHMFPVPWMAQIRTAAIGNGWLEAVEQALSAGLPVCLGADTEPETGRLIGISAAQVAALKRLPDCVVLVEADGSKSLPLKAPAPHEPAIPEVADIVVPVAGATALGQPLDEAHVHRAPLLARLAGVPAGVPVTPEIMATALLAPEGCTRGTPPGARIVPVLGQADTPGATAQLEEAGRLLVGRGAGRVLLAAPATDRPVRAVLGDVAAVVLAGGASRRFGSSKLLYPLGGRSVLEHSLMAPLQAGVREVVVVTGADHGRLELLARYPVRVVANPDWAEGMSSSLRAGLRALGAADSAGGLSEAGLVPEAAVICLGDQPYLPPQVIQTLVAAYRATGAPLVAPSAGGMRQNPVLFDRSLFGELLAVRGDQGGRAVVAAHQHRLLSVPFTEPAWFADIDTAADLP